MIASVSAIKLTGSPAESHAAKAENLKGSLEAVAGQNKFEADHVAAHTAAMDKAAADCRTLRDEVVSHRDA